MPAEKGRDKLTSMEGDGPVLGVISAQERLIGEATVLRYLPTRKHRTVGPFVFLDQMGRSVAGGDRSVAGGDSNVAGEEGNAAPLDVPPHPHIGLSTVTYLFEGAVFHRDSIGSAQLIAPGAVNWMTAGRGIVHSERTPDDLRQSPPPLFGVQCWVALPASLEDAAPAFEHVPAAELPTRGEGNVEFRLVAGSAFGEESPVSVASPLVCAALVARAAGAFRLPNDFEERALILLDGGAEVDALQVEPHSMVLLRKGAEAVVKFSRASRAILIGGPALVEKRYLDWNFCSTRRERIAEAKRLYRQKLLGEIPGEEPQLPLPEDVR